MDRKLILTGTNYSSVSVNIGLHLYGIPEYKVTG